MRINSQMFSDEFEQVYLIEEDVRLGKTFIQWNF